jgi:pheromone shutdown protein TraB
MLTELPSILVFAAAVFPLCRSFAPSSLSCRRSSTAPRQASQLLEFEEPTTGVKVKLVGTMHYNPTSIQLATDTIEELAQQDKLGSVVIESCDVRWQQTEEMNPLFQRILNSEMRAACDVALEYERPVVLGDQRINETVASMGDGFKETVSHIVNPISGWSQLVTNLSIARKRALPGGDDDNLNVFSLLDPKLLAAAPVSLAKYPLSYLVKSPLFAITVFGFLFWADSHTGNIPYNEMTVGDWIGSLGFAALETAVFARVLLKELLADRNEVIARNILNQCKLYSQPNKSQWWNILPFVSNDNRNEKDSEVIYVDGSNVNNAETGAEEEKAIVAVLGMAHCNGIMKLLKEQRV